MAEFERNPDRINAWQWDGTEKSALSILKSLKEQGWSRAAGSITMLLDPDQDDSIVRLVLESVPTKGLSMCPNSWLLVHPNDYVEILDADIFERDYREI